MSHPTDRPTTAGSKQPGAPSVTSRARLWMVALGVAALIVDSRFAARVLTKRHVK